MQQRIRGNDWSEFGYVLWYNVQYTADVSFIYFVTDFCFLVPLFFSLRYLKPLYLSNWSFKSQWLIRKPKIFFSILDGIESELDIFQPI